MTNNKKITSWDDYMKNTLNNNNEALSYLKLALTDYEKDGDTRALMLAIKRIAEANGGISNLAKKTKLNRQNLYRIFANEISPGFDTMTKILRALGIVISFKMA